MGEAIDLTSQLYPGLLERDTNLMFALKCRQFVEMVNGTDSEIYRSNIENQTSVIQSTKLLNKSSVNCNIEELNHNAMNGTNDQHFITEQIEDDVDMENTSLSTLSNSKNIIGQHKTISNSNGFKKINGDDMGIFNMHLKLIIS
jgi:hypothetical protein